MRIVFQKSYEKQFEKLSRKIQRKLFKINLLFQEDPHHATLNNHALHGKYYGYRSISVTGNIRAIYRLLDDNTALFVTIGTHTKLYK